MSEETKEKFAFDDDEFYNRYFFDNFSNQDNEADRFKRFIIGLAMEGYTYDDNFLSGSKILRRLRSEILGWENDHLSEMRQYYKNYIDSGGEVETFTENKDMQIFAEIWNCAFDVACRVIPQQMEKNNDR